MPQRAIAGRVPLFHPAYLVAATINAVLIAMTVFGVHRRYQLAALSAPSHEGETTEIRIASRAGLSPHTDIRPVAAGPQAPAAPVMAAVYLPPAVAPTMTPRAGDHAGHAACAGIDLRRYVNLAGIVQRHAPVAQPLDSIGSLSVVEFRTPVEWSGCRFDTLASETGPNVVACDGQSIALPTQPCAGVVILAMATDRNQECQVFTIEYAGGTSSTHRQSISTWRASQDLADGTVAKLMSEYISPDGQPVTRYLRLYGYRFECDPGKTAANLILPRNRHVIVLAVSTLPRDEARVAK